VAPAQLTYMSLKTRGGPPRLGNVSEEEHWFDVDSRTRSMHGQELPVPDSAAIAGVLVEHPTFAVALAALTDTSTLTSHRCLHATAIISPEVSGQQ
jgi:hypothetical protein